MTSVSLRAFISLTLAAIIVVTSQSMAVARGSSAASEQLVLCTSDGVIAVYLDADGNPTAAPHVCPECTQTFLPRIAYHRPAWAYIDAYAADFSAFVERHIIQVRTERPRNRAPPFVI
jgi:hypothetical protein